MNLIEVKDACKGFKSKSDAKIVLNKLDMKVQQGSIYSLMGASGCGKTTLISCLVGISHLDQGSIKVFGESAEVLDKSRIGYMPQELALVNEFTVREMIWFFGTLYGMDSVAIDQRFHFLSSLLELPDANKLLKDCSGGQQRRVSFALTLVHEPEILILDEPTVGVDPLLRSKIWEFLIDITSTQDVTVILSTHYIEEARKSTCIGLMRNGILLAEDSPQNILTTLETTSLEYAFMTLSARYENTEQKVIFAKLQQEQIEDKLNEINQEQLNSKTQSQKFPSSHFNNIMLALMMKNFTVIKRNFFIFMMTILLPFVACIALYLCIGVKIQGLTLGIVNGEVGSMRDCFNKSLVIAEVRDYDCTLQKVSCAFIDTIDEADIGKKFYDNLEDAYQDTKEGKINGFIQFSPNFTQSLPLFNDIGVENDISDSGLIQIRLDHTDLQKTTYIQKKIFEYYQKFMEALMMNCGKSKNAGGSPIVFEAAHGNINFDLRSTIVPGFLIGQCFLFSALITSISLITERVNGTWHRIIVAGAKPNHFILSHLVEGLMVFVIQCFIYCLFAVLLIQNYSWNSAILILSLIFFTGLSGVVFGLLVSTFFSTTNASLAAIQIFPLPMAIISGVLWPFEAMPKLLQYISIIFPFTLPIVTFRSLLHKDLTISDAKIYQGFICLSFWIVIPLVLCFILIRSK